MTIYLSLLVSIVGLVIYLACKPEGTPRGGEVGRIMFAVGLLAFLLRIAELPSIKSG